MLTAPVRSPLAMDVRLRARPSHLLHAHAPAWRGVGQSSTPPPPPDVPGVVLLVRRSGEPLVCYKSLDAPRGVAHTRVSELAELWGSTLKPAAPPAYVNLRVVRRGSAGGQPVEFIVAAADATQPTEAEEAAAAAAAPLDLRLTLSAAGVTPGTFLVGCVRGVDVPVTELKHSLAGGKQRRTTAVWKNMYARAAGPSVRRETVRRARRRHTCHRL